MIAEKDLTGTSWRRIKDGVRISISSDSEGPPRGNRSLLATRLDTGRTFWVTPEGLGRKYRQETR